MTSGRARFKRTIDQDSQNVEFLIPFGRHSEYLITEKTSMKTETRATNRSVSALIVALLSSLLKENCFSLSLVESSRRKSLR
jgi:hypothetical protein